MIDYDSEGLKYSALEKGDYISIDVIRKITGLDPYENTDLYRLRLLTIREAIWKERKIFVRCEGYALRLLKDSEAVYYKTKRFQQGYRTQKKAYDRGLHIDESQLDEETRESYRRSNNQQSRLLDVMRTEYKRIQVEERKEERLNKPLEKDIKVYSTGKDVMINGDTTIESQTDGSGAVDPS